MSRTGWHYEIMPLTFNRARIIHTDGVNVDESWCYESERAAVAALLLFLRSGATGEPEGWIRHIPSFRRRPEGDPSREYVRE